MSDSARRAPLWFSAAAGAVALVFLLAGLPAAENPSENLAPQGALRVQLDPETGEMVPLSDLSADELSARMAKQLNRSAAGLAEVQHADGGVAVDLQGRFQSLSVATIDSNGRVNTGCVTTERELGDFMDSTATTQAAATQDKE